MLPVADKIQDDLYRIYFSGRDISNRSKIGYIEININEPNTILNLSEHPVLDIGKLGTFDDNGVVTACVFAEEGKIYMLNSKIS